MIVEMWTNLRYQRLVFVAALASVAFIWRHWIQQAVLTLPATADAYRDYAHGAFERVRGGHSNDAADHDRKKSAYSIKPLAYVFPQYYAFRENDEIWGENFTEWDNVRKVTHSAAGLETIRPADSIGYYNGLDYQTRQRQARYLLDSGFYGTVYHHYWFAGRPVMDGVVQAMLEDGEPNIPFMLSWANEPWTAKWDGLDTSQVYIPQDYGKIAQWRLHFEWLLPFFRHPQYIRSEGRVQFAIYKPSHMGSLGSYMFAAWRQWAIEEGLGGLDIVETFWKAHATPVAADAVNEFAPHAFGSQDHSKFPLTKRIARVYHRGTLVCWDNTPRHVNDGAASYNPLCNPEMWQAHLVEMMRVIKSDPNPVGSENFFFVNSLNEWGEGNALEPSVQFGDRYGRAMKNAAVISDRAHVWQDEFRTKELARSAQIARQSSPRPDVCVLVRTYSGHRDDRIFNLPAMLRSLQAQENHEWRAIVFQTDASPFAELGEIVLRTLDARIQHVQPPQDILAAYTAPDAGYWTTDWVIENLDTLSPSCATAKYLLITNGDNTYEPDAFETVSQNHGDLLELNFESRWILWHHDLKKQMAWDERCVRFDEVSLVDAVWSEQPADPVGALAESQFVPLTDAESWRNRPWCYVP